MFDQQSVTAAELATELEKIIRNPERRKAMARAMQKLALPDAADRIVDICLALA